MTPGWYPDPSGRFPQRYFDGQTWTDQVVGANGMTTTDGLPGGTTPSPPAAPEPPTDASPPPPPPEPSVALPGVLSPPHGPDRSPRLSWIGIGVAGLGALLVMLSCTVLSWADGGLTFSDVRMVSDELSSSNYDDAKMAYQYGSWGWFTALFLVVAGIALVASLVSRRDGTIVRVAVALVAAVAVMSHAGFVSYMFKGPGPAVGFGAWAGVVGYLITIVGLSIATPRRRRNA